MQPNLSVSLRSAGSGANPPIEILYTPDKTTTSLEDNKADDDERDGALRQECTVVVRNNYVRAHAATFSNQYS
jgi:hypothetical protein